MWGIIWPLRGNKMTVLDRLYKGSFRGAEFLFTSVDTSRGRKLAVHEFPNKNNRYVEDLGAELSTITITAIVHGAFYEEKRNRLQVALDQPGIGILVHPFYGNINVVVQPYTVTEDINDIGAAKFQMTFLEASPNIYPASSGRNKSLINELYLSVYDFIKNDLEGEWLVNYAKNVLFAAERLRRYYDLLIASTKIISSFTGDRNQFVNDIKKANENVYITAQTPATLGSSTTELFSQFDDLASEENERFMANNKVFGFGEDDTQFSTTTEELIERDSNRKLLNGSINAISLTNMYDAAVNLEYTDELELNRIGDILENNYQILINSENSEVAPEALAQLNNLRTQTRIFFENLRITINKITEIRTNRMPVTILTYQYYADLDNYNDIINLNDIANPIIIEGDVRILSV